MEDSKNPQHNNNNNPKRQSFPESDLSNILQNNPSKNYHPSKSLIEQYQRKEDEFKDPEVLQIPKLLLPKNVLGMYDPSTHTIYLASDRFPYEMSDTPSHESAHSYRIHSEEITHTHATGHINVRVEPYKNIQNNNNSKFPGFNLAA